MELIRQFSAEQYAMALDSWRWAGVADKQPMRANATGDLFLQGGDGAFWFLDTIDGLCERRWDDGTALQNELNTRDGQQEYLWVDLVEEATASGLVPGADEVYDFAVPPRLGGALELANVVVRDFVVAVNLAGQLHEQVNGLPDGATISEVRFEPPSG